MKNNFTFADEKIPAGKKNFLIQLTIEVPYPKDFSYTIEANFCGTAINRAIKKMKKEIKGKHLKRIRITASRL